MISKNPPKVFIRLLSCSFYNSWQKLKRDGEFSTSDDGHGNAMIEKIPSSHYTLNTIKKSSKEHFKSNSWTFSSITQRVQLSLEIYPTEMFVSIVIFLPSPDPKHENFRWDHGFQPSPSEAWDRDNLRINKMAAEIIHPTAPPHIYPPLLKGEDFRLNICDYQKELESDISHYKKVAKKGEIHCSRNISFKWCHFHSLFIEGISEWNWHGDQRTTRYLEHFFCLSFNWSFCLWPKTREKDFKTWENDLYPGSEASLNQQTISKALDDN